MVAHENPAGYALEAVDETAELHGRGERYEEVYVVGSPVELVQTAAEGFAYVAHDGFEPVKMFSGEDPMPVFCDENQMRVKVEDTVSSLAYLIVGNHETKYNDDCWRPAEHEGGER